jgi:hypothetical protein
MGQSATAPLSTKATGAAPGRLTVGDYIGVPAAEAARAVRRAGLRPGLDRQLGHDGATVGLVVAQDPEPGSSHQRGGMVVLFVGAPHPRDGRKAEEREEPPAACALQEMPGARSGSAHPQPSARRRRKARPALAGTRPGEPRPEPRAEDPLTTQPTLWVQQQPTAQESDGEVLDHEDAAPPTFDPSDILTVAEHDLGRGGAYPHKPLRLRASSARSWVLRRRTALIACALIGGWLGFAVEHRGHGSTGSQSALASGAPRAPSIATHGADGGQPAQPIRTRVRATRRTPAANPHRPRRRAVGAARRASRPVSASAQAVVEGGPPPEQSAGGPFSP